VFVTDRKLVKLYKLFRVRSWLLIGGSTTRDDLRLRTYRGETEQEIALLRDNLPSLLGLR
jgi:MoxR-like ATPase